MIRFIRKRNGSTQAFDIRKIHRAILAACYEATPQKVPDVTELTAKVIRSFGAQDNVPIETIQDHIETVLMGERQFPAAKAFILYREKRAALRTQRKTPDTKAIADYIHMAKYSRNVNGKQEVWEESCDRVRDMHIRKFPDQEIRIRDAFNNYVKMKKVTPSMRSMQFAGPAIEQHHAKLYNCSFTLVDRPEAFWEAFYLLLCGCGVGYSVQWQHVNRLPEIGFIDKKKVYHHTASDTIEGWADCVKVLFHSYLYMEKYVEFNWSVIRDEGEELRTSGGKAPGHLALKAMIEEVRSILHKAQGRRLRPIECHDIICHIATAVLSGGIRRSSLMCIFSPEDTEMMYCKTPGVFEYGGLNDQRQMANNAAAFLRGKVSFEDFHNVLEINGKYGDPGFFLTDNLDYGTNPCGEIGLMPVLDDETGFAFCNLTGVNCSDLADADDFIERCGVAAFIGTLQAAYTDFKYLAPVTKRIAKRDALLGVSMTGMCDSPEICFDPEILRRGVERVRIVNQSVADQIGIRPAKRLTTVKPSGTESLVLGAVGSGIHKRHARRYFRRVTANPNEPAAQFFKKYNPHMVEQKPNGDWSIIFPIQCKENAETIKDSTAKSFLDQVFLVYDNWVKPGTNGGHLTHNVSCTVTFRPEERKEVQDIVWNNRDRIAAMAFAPIFLDESVPFIPNKEVKGEKDERLWDYLITNYVPVPWKEMEAFFRNVNEMEPACAGGACSL